MPTLDHHSSPFKHRELSVCTAGWRLLGLLCELQTHHLDIYIIDPVHRASSECGALCRYWGDLRHSSSLISFVFELRGMISLLPVSLAICVGPSLLLVLFLCRRRFFSICGSVRDLFFFICFCCFCCCCVRIPSVVDFLFWILFFFWSFSSSVLSEVDNGKLMIGILRCDRWLPQSTADNLLIFCWWIDRAHKDWSSGLVSFLEMCYKHGGDDIEWNAAFRVVESSSSLHTLAVTQGVAIRIHLPDLFWRSIYLSWTCGLPCKPSWDCKMFTDETNQVHLNRWAHF